MYLNRVIAKNVEPFGDLDITFNETDVIAISAKNGRGKTTLLSYIADAFFELAKVAGYEDILKDNSKYYRVTSPLGIKGNERFSLVYLRFVNDDVIIDYTEVVGNIEENQFNIIANLENKISFSKIKNSIDRMGSAKLVSADEKLAQEVFESCLMTYFPSDRLEIPVWLNDIEYKESRFNTKARFSRRLKKNIEARTISSEVVNWILDVVLDRTISTVIVDGNPQFSDSYSSSLYHHLNQILQEIMIDKTDKCRFGISPRQRGETRVALVKDIEKNKQERVSEKICVFG